MKKELYFINDIIKQHKGEEYIVTAFKIYDKTKYIDERSISNEVDNKYIESKFMIPLEERKNCVNSKIFYFNKSKLIKNKIEEGKFFYISDEKSNKISIKKAGRDRRAKRQVYINNMIRGNLIKKYTTPKNIELQRKQDIYSYHINVGHGNCSVIVIKSDNSCKLWMIDCSTIDFTNKVYYGDNIEECFTYIKNKFNLDNIKIEKLFITHPHFDHYNGVNYLINKKYIENTEVWINLYYQWPDSKYNLLLERLRSLNVKLVEPKVSNGNNTIEILYPNNTILRTKPSKSIKNYPPYTIVPTKKINNSSTVLKFNFGCKSMIFPGDIEEEGWNNVRYCFRNSREDIFYCISHHGSITGHRRSNCRYVSVGSIQNIDSCYSSSKINILMGRDNAYSGIFNQVVLNTFMNRIYKTDLSDKNEILKFIELNWKNDEIIEHKK